jgi:NAD(P)-dependent dehydrogenase (short-subunit alcohol dehydrogenase family)
MNDIPTEVVVVTGASAGVGRAVVRAFARRGARIGLLARGEEGLEGARREVEELGGQAIALPTDVADPAQVEAAAEAVERELGPIDVWVNDAMVSVFSPVKEMSSEEFRRVTEVTYLGYVYGTLAALRRMLARDRGAIVQVGSALAYRSIPLQSAYCAAKHAVKGFTESLWCELLHDKSHVHVAMVQMPALNTPQFDWTRSRLPRRAQPVPPIFQPEIAADAVVWAAHHRRRELYVGFPTLKAILGNRVAPRLLDHYLARVGYSSQQTEEPESVSRPDDLWTPVAGDHGAHGRFDARARGASPQLWMNTHRGLLGAAAAVALALLRPSHEVNAMNEIQTSMVVRTTAGALSGAICALVRRRGLRVSQRLPVRLQPTQPRRDPDAFLVAKLERTLHRPLPWRLHGALASGLHAGYGAATGALLAVVTRRRGLGTAGRAVLAGTALGAAVWAVGYAGWMPRARLVPRLRGQGLNHVTASLLAFTASGVVTALPVLFLDRAARRRPWWRRALAAIER